MGFTINLFQPKRKKQKSQGIPIYLRLYKDGRSKYINTKIYVPRDKWNPNKQRVRKSHDNHAPYNDELLRLKSLAERAALDLRRNNNLTLDALARKIELGDGQGVIEYARTYLDHLSDEGSYWEHRKFKVLINDMERHFGNAVPDIGSVGPGEIEGFQDFLLKGVSGGKDNAPNTVRRKLRRLRGMFRHARKNNVIGSDPFEGVALVKKEPSNRTALSPSQIEDIKLLSLEDGGDLWHARNYFLYSFYNAGIRFGDLCTLEWDNLIDGRLKYKMRKTGGRKRIKQIPRMEEILDRYRQSRDPGVNDFVFPILDNDRAYTRDTLQGAISSKNVIVNRNLKKIAELAGVGANISFHISRHSFAVYALKKGMSIYQISKALGHSSIKQTERYLRGFDEELLDKGMEDIFEGFFD